MWVISQKVTIPDLIAVTGTPSTPSAEEIMVIGDHRSHRNPASTGRSTGRHVVRDSAYWRERAAEARALAEDMSPDYQGKMLEIGKVYDGLAQQAERRERQTPLASESARLRPSS